MAGKSAKDVTFVDPSRLSNSGRGYRTSIYMLMEDRDMLEKIRRDLGGEFIPTLADTLRHIGRVYYRDYTSQGRKPLPLEGPKKKAARP